MGFCRRLAICLAVLILGGGCAVHSAPRDLRGMERSSTPNDALACPPATCQAKSDIESPVFEVEARRLAEIVRQVISAQARTDLVDEDAEMAQVVFVQRSRVFGFPDTIWIQSVDLGPQSSLIMYSRSNYGVWDMGVNRRRVRDWLAEVEAAARK